MISQKVLKMCNSSKKNKQTKQHSKYQADDIKIFLPGVTMVLGNMVFAKQFQIDQWLMVILLRWQFTIEVNFIECLERLSSRS